MELGKSVNQTMFEFILDRLPEAISVRDKDGWLLYRNRAYRALYGENDKPVGQDPFQHVHPDDRDRVRETFKQVIRSLGEDRAEYRATLQDGLIHSLESHGTPILNSAGEVTGMMIVTSDLTRPKEIERARERQQREQDQRLAEMAELNAMATQLYRCNSVTELRKVLASSVRKLCVPYPGALYLFNADLNQFEEFLTWGEFHAEEKYFCPDHCWAVRSGNGVHLVANPEVERVLRCAHVHSSYPYLCMQLRGKGDTHLILHLLMAAEHKRLPTNEDDLRSLRIKQELATAVARHAALAIENLRQKDSLREAAELDALTGLFNRHYMNSTLRREVLRANRKNATLGVVMIDVDHFKQINDSFTHSGGDYVLREVGQFLRSHVRETDIACRYGGEEFMLIMPDTTVTGLLERSEALRSGVKALALEFMGRPMNVTISAGVAFMNGTEVGATESVRSLPHAAQFIAEASADEIKHLADMALYQAKREGRDRVVVWSGAETAER